jgi:hypothetical protein
MFTVNFSRNRKIWIAIAVAAIATTSVILAGTFATTGFFFKAFDKTLSPGEQYERNVTVRQYYNLTVRFQKETSSTTYLTFDSNDTTIVLKNTSGNELASGTGVINAKMYFLMTKPTLDSIVTISAANLGEYEDVVDQQVNKTFSGTTAYITIKVHSKPPVAASMFGTVTDELTSASVQGVTVAAFDDGADPSTASIINSSVSDSNGRYSMQFQLNASKAFDVYVSDYDVS